MKPKTAILIDPYKAEISEIILNEPGEPECSIRKALNGKHFAIYSMLPNGDVVYVGDEMGMREEKDAKFWKFIGPHFDVVGYGVVVGEENPFQPGEDYLADVISKVDKIKSRVIFL